MIITMIGSCMILEQLIRGKTFKLDCQIFNSIGEYQDVQLLFDTGASTTTIRKDFLTLLGYNHFPLSKVKTRTGNGFIYMEQCKIDKIKINNITFISIRMINVFEPRDDDIDHHGVIGMDIVSRLETHISRERNSINITSTSDKLDIVKEYEKKIKKLLEEMYFIDWQVKK